MEKDESFYDALYNKYSEIKNSKDFFLKKKGYATLLFNLRTAYNKGDIESIESLPKDPREVYIYNEFELVNLEKKLEELYFPK